MLNSQSVVDQRLIDAYKISQVVNKGKRVINPSSQSFGDIMIEFGEKSRQRRIKRNLSLTKNLRFSTIA